MRKAGIPHILMSAVLFLSCAGMLHRMTERDVIELSRAEVGDEVIVRHIEASGAIFDLSTEDILELRAAGVSEQVIEKMLATRIDRRRAWEEWDRGHPVCRWAYADSMLTKDDILKMIQSGVGDEVIVRYIEARGRFDLTVDEIVELKAAGVSDAVIEAMVKTGEREPPEVMYNIHYPYPYPIRLYWDARLYRRYYDWHWRPYLWRAHYRPYSVHDLSIAHPSHKYYLHTRRW